MGEYRLIRRAPRSNEGVVDWLLACPEKDFFAPIESVSTRRCEVPRRCERAQRSHQGASPNELCLAWLQHHEREIAVNPVILGEIRYGILLLPKGKRRRRLERWFDAGVQRLQCLPWDAVTGLRWAELLASLRQSGRAMPIKDSLVAATALVHGLIVATRNRADFEKADVKMVDFFDAAS